MEEIKQLIPNGVFGHTITGIYERFVLLGGAYNDENGINISNYQIEFSLQEQQWKKINPENNYIFTPRYYHAAFVYENNKIFIFGGKSNKTTLIESSFICLKFEENKWKWNEVKIIKGKISNRFGCSVAEFMGCFYLFGGSTMKKKLNDVYKIDVINGDLKISQVKVDNKYIIPRSFHQCFKSVKQNSLQFLGGKFDEKKEQYLSFGMKIKKQEQFTINPMFHQIDDLYYFSICIINDNIIVVGGKDESKTFNNEIKIFNFTNKEWHSIPGISIVKAAMFSYDYQIYVIGGIKQSKKPNYVYQFSLEDFTQRDLIFSKRNALFEVKTYNDFLDIIDNTQYSKNETLNKSAKEMRISIKESDDLIVSSITRGILRQRRSLIEKFYLTPHDILLICKRFMQIVTHESNLISLNSNLFCFGSIFGQYQSLQKWFRRIGYPTITANPKNQIKYLFLGNFLNFGMNSLENVISLFALKIRYPNSVYIITGIEEENISMNSKLANECSQKIQGPNKLKIETFLMIKKAISYISEAVVIGKTLCINQFPKIKTLSEIQNIKKPRTFEQLQITKDSFKLASLTGRIPYKSQDDINTMKKFLKNNNLKKIIISDSIVSNGYFKFSKKIVNLLSCFHVDSMMIDSYILYYSNSQQKWTKISYSKKQLKTHIKEIQ